MGERNLILVYNPNTQTLSVIDADSKESIGRIHPEEPLNEELSSIYSIVYCWILGLSDRNTLPGDRGFKMKCHVSRKEVDNFCLELGFFLLDKFHKKELYGKDNG